MIAGSNPRAVTAAVLCLNKAEAGRAAFGSSTVHYSCGRPIIARKNVGPRRRVFVQEHSHGMCAPALILRIFEKEGTIRPDAVSVFSFLPEASLGHC